MNPTDAAVAELATAPSASMAKFSLPSAQVRSGHMEIRHRGFAPSVHPDAYVAPTAVLSGQVSVVAGSCIMHGAVPADGRICRIRPVPSTNQPFNSASTSEIAMNRIHPTCRRMWWAAGCGPDQRGRHDERG
jgi:hypothetical protein